MHSLSKARFQAAFRTSNSRYPMCHAPERPNINDDQRMSGCFLLPELKCPTAQQRAIPHIKARLPSAPLTLNQVT